MSEGLGRFGGKGKLREPTAYANPFGILHIPPTQSDISAEWLSIVSPFYTDFMCIFPYSSPKYAKLPSSEKSNPVLWFP